MHRLAVSRTHALHIVMYIYIYILYILYILPNGARVSFMYMYCVLVSLNNHGSLIVYKHAIIYAHACTIAIHEARDLKHFAYNCRNQYVM